MHKKLLSLSTIGCMLIGICMYAGAAHEHKHDDQVVGKTLVSVRPGYIHDYVSGTKTDPVTGEVTPIYSVCKVLRDV